eukprot:Blabericola_migrator_1__6446@NODE_3252_length_1910_cov_225_284319_g2034_i0_p1_GENE_NODE_3252_length_1910_cov_225_284319_g2034_i0NODE_3252_length_1910_cov_225_284319_g2034_i0_p1_ORF_typecomplete_len351_score82_07HOOK/PF05622_12/2_5e20MAD/PF05557_13/1e07CENPF_leu_zip/PF10473_9/0_0083CENPF_leu_zip/PF10473_9/0_0057CENPF_leu_zip/PF10473_9/3_7CENPF_leu_zip/PF10473_9/5_6ZapB/PF06005_12/5_3ZapB/PF06005_12/0_37ZapB/PF06005_12/0_074ZapB/PF06005_12/1_2ZapB/PF06005_12/0_066DUF4407/PF14362_6/3_7DUF4407/PF143
MRPDLNINLASVRSDQSQEYAGDDSGGESDQNWTDKETVDELERQIQQLEAEKQKLMKEKEDALDAARKDRDALLRRQQELDELHQENSDLNESKDGLKKEIKELQRRYEGDVKRLKDSLAEMEEYKERYVSTTKQMERYKAKMDLIVDAQNEVDRLNQELSEKMADVAELERQNADLAGGKSQMEQMRASMAEQAAALISAQTQASVFQKETQSLREKVTQLERERDDLQVQLTIVQDRTSGTGVMQSMKGDSTTELKGQIARLEAQLRGAQQGGGKSVAELEQELDIAKRTQEALQARLHSMMTSTSAGAPADQSGLLSLQHEVYSRIIHRLLIKWQEAQCEHQLEQN